MFTLTYTLSILLMILIPVVLAVLLRRRFKVAWLLFCAGILTFVGSQIVHLPLNELLGRLGIIPNAHNSIVPPLWQTALVMGLTAGVCEELARTAGFAILKRYRTFADGVMMGLGHGGIEAMVFGAVQTAASISSLLSLTGTDLSKLSLSAEQLAVVQKQIQTFLSSPWLAVLPLLERCLAIGMQVVLSMLVWRAFNKRNAFYVLVAITYHTLVDFAAVYGSQHIQSPWLFEGIFALMLVPGLVWLVWIFPRRKDSPVHPVSPVKHEFSVFWTALGKEMLQQWRTRRILVVAAVFGLFGMFSPLMAYFMPQIIKAIPGAEQFASLVPTPTTMDAMAQYIKSLSQFGFIVALLLGMGAVAGEKERGTSGMILSKPMTRWAFVTSKLVSQALVYAGGFLLAMIAAYFYTVVLFGSLDFISFALINILLFAWLMPYAATTILGSVIGNSTGAAAGIGLGFAVVLLLSETIPLVGKLMPGALIAWASQLGLLKAGPVPSNAGALAFSFVLCLICLVTGIAIFEQQEL